MVRRSPCERYIKFLLVHPDGYSVQAVRDIIRGHALDYPSDDYLERLSSRLNQYVPHPFKPLNKGHGASRRFLVKEQLYGFFHPDPSALMAHRLLNNGRAKETIESMAISGEAPAFISHRVKLAGTRCSPEAVNRYLFFYWDITLVDSTELRALLKMRVERLQQPESDDNPSFSDQWVQYNALKSASYKDPRRMLVEMPVTPVAGALGQMRLGLMPAQLDLSRIAEAARGAATLRAFEAMVVGGPGDAARGRDYAMVSSLMSDLIEKVGNPDVALQQELQQLALATEDGPVPHIGELPAADSITLDLLPTKESIHAVDKE